MGLIVKKFGGTSVATTQRLFAVVDIIKKTYEEGHKIIAVVSARGNTTDELISIAHEIDTKIPERELDVLLSSGEQISMSLLAMALNKKGLPAISLTGWQAGFNTCNHYGNARIKGIYPKRIKEELDKENIVIIAGFQGINDAGDITTMGRGGSDTSAVALAAAMNADECRIYTDVKGVYRADPNIIPDAIKLDKISYNDMIAFASLGTKVLNKRSVETAKKYNVIINVLSSFEETGNTLVCEIHSEKSGPIKGISSDKSLLLVNMFGVEPENIKDIFDFFAKENVLVSNIWQNGLQGQHNKLEFTLLINKSSSPNIFELLDSLVIKYKFNIFLNSNVSKISIVTSDKESQIETSSKVIKYLKDFKIISMFIDSDIISLIIPNEDTQKVVEVIYSKFFKL